MKRLLINILTSIKSYFTNPIILDIDHCLGYSRSTQNPEIKSNGKQSINIVMHSPKFQLLSCLLLALATFALATGAKFPSDNDGTAKSTDVEGEPGCGWRYGLPSFHRSLPAPSTTVTIKTSPTHNLEANNAIPIRHSVHFTPITFGLPAQATAHAHAKRDDAAIPVINVLEWNIQPKPTCTITFWQFPTPYQRGSASTVWTATTVVTDYFDCSGCAMEIQHIPKSRTHFTETTTISS